MVTPRDECVLFESNDHSPGHCAKCGGTRVDHAWRESELMVFGIEMRILVLEAEINRLRRELLLAHAGAH